MSCLPENARSAHSGDFFYFVANGVRKITNGVRKLRTWPPYTRLKYKFGSNKGRIIENYSYLSYRLSYNSISVKHSHFFPKEFQYIPDHITNHRRSGLLNMIKSFENRSLEYAEIVIGGPEYWSLANRRALFFKDAQSQTLIGQKSIFKGLFGSRFIIFAGTYFHKILANSRGH